MAIQTVKATIQMRRGLEQDFDADQMTAGEWAVSTDTKYVRMCFAPGIAVRMATYEAFEQDMREIQLILATCQDIQVAVDAMASLAEQHKNDSAESALLSESWAHGETGVRVGEDENNSEFYSQKAKLQADRAKNEADRAAAIVGYDIDATLSGTSTNPVQNKVITEALKEKINNDGDASLATITFSQAASLANIQSGDSLATAFGKLSKFCASFGDAAFCSVANNLNTTAAGSVLDARQGKALDDKLTELNGNLPTVANNLTTTGAGSVLDARQGKILNDKLSVTKNDIRIYPCDFSGDTLLNFYKSNPKLLGCFIIGTNVPTDAPANKEGYALFLRDAGSGRAIVLYIVFDSSWMYHRTIFNGSWLTNWSQI